MYLYLISSGDNNNQYAVGSGCMYILSNYRYFGPTIGASLSYIPDGYACRNTNVNQSVVGGFIGSEQNAGAYGFDILDKPSGHWWQVDQIYIPDGFLYENTKRSYLITGGDANDSRVGFVFCRLSSVSGNYGWAIGFYFLADTIQFNNSTASYILIGGSIWDNTKVGMESCALINASSANSPYIEPVHTRYVLV